MPLYEYRCEECGRAFELLRRFSEVDRDVKCPVCDSEDVQRQMSSFATAPGCGSGGGGRRYG